MNCPACKARMVERDFGSAHIDVCEQGCRGLWFDGNELPRLDEPHEGFGASLASALAQPPHARSRGRLLCPSCGLSMHEHRYAGAPGVIVDECFACRGIFLDPGELGLIRAHFASLTRTAGIDTDPLTAEPVWSQRIAELEEKAQTSEELTALCRELMKRLRPFGV